MDSCVKLGVCPSWWMDEPDGGDLENYLSAAAAAEYQGVELGFRDPRGLEKASTLLRENGLELAAAVYSGSLSTTPYEREEKAMAAHAETVGRLEGDSLVFEDAAWARALRSGGPGRDLVREYAEKMTTMAGFLRERFGVTLVYRHHGEGDAVDLSRELLLETGDDVGFSLDIGALCGMDADLIRALGRRIRLLHVARPNALGDAPFTGGKKTRKDAGRVGVFLADIEYSGWVMAEQSRAAYSAFFFERHEVVRDVRHHAIPWWEV